MVAGRVVLVAALVGVSVLVLVNSRDELLAAASQISGVAPLWVVLAALLEVLSYTAYAAAQRVLLRAGGAQVGLLAITLAAIVAQAFANCVPGGLAVSGLTGYRQLTRRGVRPVLAGWVLVLSSGLFMAALALLSLVAAQIAGDSSPVPGLQATSAALAVGLAVVTGVLLLLRNQLDPARAEVVIRARLARLARWRRRRAGVGNRSRGEGDVPGEAPWTAQVSTFRVGPWVLAGGLLCMLLSWLFDVAVLVAAFRAVAALAPWRGLLLAYCAGQVAAAVPVTPGGLGVVEGSLTLALVAFGGSEHTTLAAVLLYRLVSFWGLFPVAAVGWALLRRTRPPAAARLAPAPPSAGGTRR